MLATALGIGLPIVLVVGIAAGLLRSTPTVHEGSGRCGGATQIEPTARWGGDGSAADSVGGHDAVLRGGVTFGPGVVGQAFVLDGTSGFVEVPDTPALDLGSGDFAVSLWVNFRSTVGEQVLAEDWIARGKHSVGWTMSKMRRGTIAITGAGGGAETPLLQLPIGTWVHVVATRTGGFLTMYLNGRAVATQPITDPLASKSSSSSLKFGHRGDPSDTPGSLGHRGLFVAGSLDEIEFFVGTGLTAGQVENLFEQQSSCLP